MCVAMRVRAAFEMQSKFVSLLSAEHSSVLYSKKGTTKFSMDSDSGVL